MHPARSCVVCGRQAVRECGFHESSPVGFIACIEALCADHSHASCEDMRVLRTKRGSLHSADHPAEQNLLVLEGRS